MPSSEQFEDGMPKFDDAGREVMRAVADNEAGWRYVYRDETVLWGYKDFDAAAKSKGASPAASSALSTTPSSGVSSSLSGVASSLSDTASTVSTATGWGDPNAKPAA